MPGRLTRRTAPFEGAYVGATPAPAASHGCAQAPLGGEIVSRLAYTQKSRGRNLPKRPLPRGVISSVLVSETSGLGANPSEAARFISTKNKHLAGKGWCEKIL